MNKTIVTIILLVLISIIAGYLFLNQSNTVKRSFFPNDLSKAETITCTYPQIVNANYLNNVISHAIPEPEKNPIIFTFSNLKNKETGQLSYIDSTQTITNVLLIKILESDKKIVYLDGTGENYLSTHTIYKQNGISAYTKNVELLPGVPFITMSMGNCVGY